MFSSRNTVLTIKQIENRYPNQWVAVAVLETDADGLAAAGEVIAHNSDDRFVWPVLKLGELDTPVYVFYTGTRTSVLPPDFIAQVATA
jgi:hypothetical protein